MKNFLWGWPWVFNYHNIAQRWTETVEFEKLDSKLRTQTNYSVLGGEKSHFILWSLKKTSTMEPCGSTSHRVEQKKS